MNTIVELKLTETKKLKAEFRTRPSGELIELETLRWQSSNPNVVTVEAHDDGTCTIKPVGPLGQSTVSCVGLHDKGMVGSAVNVHVGCTFYRPGISQVL